MSRIPKHVSYDVAEWLALTFDLSPLSSKVLSREVLVKKKR